MKRAELEHVLRSTGRIVEDRNVLIIGSQSVLGTFLEGDLPLEATASMEVDVAFFDDPDDQKADQIDAFIGEFSPFHETFGYYAQGVSVSTAVLPDGWRDRLVLVESDNTQPGRGYALDPHDCVVSKLVAGREKDNKFADALLRAGLVRPDVVAERIELLADVHPLVMKRLRDWIAAYQPGPEAVG
ncbi:DUF6036 family nucleotidyltransferase [Verrucosispora sp. NA02020]|uniref:DUF6036 family nucleotidyltransferase n=1 Tax=Verrucosispora sp. NA02020 TaxID=2742132 RepID=UPI0015919CED|nr:DUF6036 family nucleotidyltransferase [Verrucosispora sp. NA02020]QKW15732.1 hypothetical protein HUT12_25150 [Verrucosispora sp. NA02020]